MGGNCHMAISIYGGSANPTLAEGVARRLRVHLGRRRLKQFPDGETHVQIEESIRGRDIYIVQSTSAPVNQHIMEILIMVDAFRRAAAGRITAIIPYYGYARQEKKSTGREPITARLVADLLTVAGTERVVSIDLHSPAIQGFFNIGMDHLTAVPLITEHLHGRCRPNSVIVSPDTGRVKLAEKYARALGLPLVVLHKQRSAPEEAEIRAVVGDVQGKAPIIVDDMISTGGTIAGAVEALLRAGARPEVIVAATHPVLVGPALERLSHPAISEVVVCDTIPVPPAKHLPKMHMLSVADLLAATVRRLNRNESISALFAPAYGRYAV
jgi:ribose-phosphate pyrophosphokinase